MHARCLPAAAAGSISSSSSGRGRSTSLAGVAAASTSAPADRSSRGRLVASPASSSSPSLLAGSSVASFTLCTSRNARNLRRVAAMAEQQPSSPSAPPAAPSSSPQASSSSPPPRPPFALPLDAEIKVSRGSKTLLCTSVTAETLEKALEEVKPWAPNARVLRSLFSDLAAQARTAFGSEVRFAVVDTGGGGGENAASSGNGAGGGGGGSGRAAASLAERCGVGALPSFQVWQGGELAVSLGGAEAAAVVASSAEEGEGEAAAAAPSAGLAARLRSALSGLKAFPAAASAAASAASAASSSAPSSPASLRTRLAEELRARAGPPLPPSSWLSRALRPLGPVARALSGMGSRHRRGLLAAAAAAAAVGLALGSAQSARASRKWQQERYDWLPSEAHRKRARAEAVARHAGRRAQLGGLSFLAPATYLLQWALGKGGAHGDSPLGPRFPTSEFSDVLDPPPVPLPDIDFENQVDGDKLKTWLLESRKLAARQKKRLAPERMEEEAAALGREVRRWEYVKAIEAEEARRARELSSSDASSAALLGDPRPKKEERRAVLAGDVEHVDLRGVYRRLGK